MVCGRVEQQLNVIARCKPEAIPPSYSEIASPLAPLGLATTQPVYNPLLQEAV